VKILATIAGFDAARRWYRSAKLEGAAAAKWNREAALVTAVSVGLGALSLLIDSFWVAPAGSWGP
jgi:hypothetical protein